MLRKHAVSFKNAVAGIAWVIRTQHNFRAHLILSMLAVILSMYLHISHEEFLVVILVIFIGLVVETINTAIEEVADAVDKEWRPDIKIAKDTAAAAMLLYAIGSVLIAIEIFVPKIIALWKF